ncbi:MAG: DeoR/GlpR family DNA-binding transcription regulator [Lachnospiraceae bacterium]|nr:DeoR/GlpR family DNA-binding transcription regulator [Lachnospiraceae bacterium]
MLAAERRGLIFEKIQEEKSVIVSELSRAFAVSEETIRRDLEKLAEEGHVVKSYGGAVLNEKSGIDLPFNVRQKANPKGKQMIAALVSQAVSDGEHIMLDASTTSVFIAKSIKQKENLTVITNSIENLLELSDAPSFHIISTGGTFHAGTMSLLGKRAAECIATYHVDKLFLSCKAIDPEKGVMDGSDEIAGIKQEMLRAAKKVYLAVDSSKFNKAALSLICPLTRIDAVITDRKPSEKWLKVFEKNRVECIFRE